MTFNTLITPLQLAQHLHQPDWVIFDVRFNLADTEAGARAYRHGHIAHARYAHLDRDLSSQITAQTGRHPLPDFNQLAQKLSNWGVSNSSQIVIYDDAGCAFAGRFWWLLRCLGHENAAVLDGGLQNWKKHALPLTTHLPQYHNKSYRAYIDTSSIISASELENQLARNTCTLIDARAADRFHGKIEPIDPIAGHIPKALNRPLQNNLDVHGCFLPAHELRKQFNQLIQHIPAQQVVHMCGSGVTACHNLLAMEIAGLPGSKLYSGSWSEWIRNKNRALSRQ